MKILDIFQSKGKLKKIIINIEQDIKGAISSSFKGKFTVLHYGSYEINPKNLVFWICVETDAIKEKLECEFNNKLKYILLKNKYPNDSINDVYIGFESQETVDRDSNGDWYLHFK